MAGFVNMHRDIDSADQYRALSVNHNKDDLAVLLRDVPDWLGDIQRLRETDVIILLTPVMIPVSRDPTDTSDPFG